MLIIRRDQLAALAEPLRRRFVDGLIPRLRERRPVETASLTEASLRAVADDAFALGARYGIELFRDVETCAELLVVRGRGFDEASEPPELREILSNAAIPGEAKARWLEENLLQSA